MRILITSIVDMQRSAHNRLHQFVRYLSREHQVTVLSIKDWWKSQQTDTSLYSQGFEDIWERVDIRYFTNRRVSPILQELLSLVTVGRLLREVGDSFDVHLNYNTLISGLLVATKMKAAGVGTVYDLADDLSAMIGTSPQIPPVLRPLGAAFASLMVRCNLMISERVTLTTGAIPLPRSSREKCVVLPNGVDTMLFRKQDDSELREELRIGDDFVLGYVGVLREWVDFEPSFAALAKLRAAGHRVKLLIVGEEGGIVGPSALAQRYGVLEHVIFAGTVPYPEVPQYMSCMNAGLIPFRKNPVTTSALPLKMLEYMACEVPVMSTRLPGIETAVGNRVLFASDHQEIFCDVMLLRESELIRTELALQGRRFVEENYAWNRIALQLEGALSTDAKAPRGAR